MDLMTTHRDTGARFWKMHGAGNDFAVWVDAEETFPFEDASRLSRMAHRPEGIGCDGQVVLQPSKRADFRMRFVNPDGREVSLCGNGLRCAARLAYDLGWTGRSMTIETSAGILRGRVEALGVWVEMPAPRDLRLDLRLSIGGSEWTYASVNIGVPHVVIRVDHLDAVDVPRWGRAIRYDARFMPDGTNVDFFALQSDGVYLRTYERGVEAETAACGTGAVAVAIVAAAVGQVQPPVEVLTRGGTRLQVAFKPGPQGGDEVWLFGPATYVFEGRLLPANLASETSATVGGLP